MKVFVAGLWHLGAVTAACLAHAGHDVIAFDDSTEVTEALARGNPPVSEPGLSDLTRRSIESGRLRFTSDAKAVRDADVVWVTYDTPVNADDEADSAFVISRVESLFASMGNDVLVVISSQLPVGSTAALEKSHAAANPGHATLFVNSPENLRLGKAIDVFMNPDRVVAGARHDAARQRFSMLLAPITTSIEWMSIESAEMTKHALNAFLATSVTFINEIATICEAVGADAKEVERGLKSDIRIGSKAYLAPGAAFAGGTLARDVAFLSRIRPLPLISNVKVSNDRHKTWARDRINDILGPAAGRVICLWGLTYKPGTDTLRRSPAIELARGLARDGARVTAYDPAVTALPEDLRMTIDLRKTAEDAASQADAIVVTTEWPEFRAIGRDALPERPIVVIDANQFLSAVVAARNDVRYFSVGRAAP